jgi:dihydroorotase
MVQKSQRQALYRLKNAKVLNASGPQLHPEIWVEDGIWVKTPSNPLADIPTFDAEGLTVIPAGVDPQVHLRVPGQPQKELPETGLQAAIRGGIGALLNMPNTNPIIDSAQALQMGKREVEQAQKEAPVTVLWSATITEQMAGKSSAPFAELVKAGASALTDDGLGVEQDEHMNAAFAASAEYGVPVLQHAEVPGHGAALASGPLQKKLGLPAYPRSAEIDMVARDLKLLEKFPEASYHVLHVSCKETVELVADAKAKGLKVTCEVSPHHLALSSADIQEDKTYFKMNPPLRDRADAEYFQAALRDGQIDFVATDHAPHELESKEKPFPAAAFGTTGLETSLRVLTDFVQKDALSESQLVRVFSASPAKFLGVEEKFGTLSEGRPFNACLVDFAAPAKAVEPKDLWSKSKNNCFLGTALPDPLSMVFLESWVCKIDVH